MKIHFIQPLVELKPYIKSIWVFESPVGMPLLENNLAIPNGCPRLIINCDNSIASIVNGQTQQSRERNIYFVGIRDIPVQLFTTNKKTVCIGIEFYPHGAYPIFGIPMDKTANRLFQLDILLEKWGKNINETVSSLENVNYKINFIERKLLESLLKNHLQNPLVDFCVNTLKSTNGLIAVSELENKTGYSKRYLEILFKNHIGFSPKVLARIFRFQKFCRDWANGYNYEGVKDELYNYYYDQAHYVKEFKRMTGFSPRNFEQKVTNEFGRQLTLH